MKSLVDLVVKFFPDGLPSSEFSENSIFSKQCPADPRICFHYHQIDKTSLLEISIYRDSRFSMKLPGKSFSVSTDVAEKYLTLVVDFHVLFLDLRDITGEAEDVLEFVRAAIHIGGGPFVG